LEETTDRVEVPEAFADWEATTSTGAVLGALVAVVALALIGLAGLLESWGVCVVTADSPFACTGNSMQPITNPTLNRYRIIFLNYCPRTKYTPKAE
jgi:hypothetical protein